MANFLTPLQGGSHNCWMKNTSFLHLGIFTVLIFSTTAYSQGRFQISGVQGSVGAGFTEYNVISPEADIEFDRGIYASAAGEKAFHFANLYLTISLGYMDVEGRANYDYTNLSSSTTYQVDDVAFKARMMELGLGLKFKLIDDYWLRPYIEAGGLGSWHELRYTSKSQELSAIGSDYKSKDTIMGHGFYGEVGIEVQFSERLGVKLAGRLSESSTRKLDTLGKRSLKYRGGTFYLSALMGF